MVYLEHLRTRVRLVQKCFEERLLIIHSGKAKPSKRGLTEGLARDLGFHFKPDAPSTKSSAWYGWK